MSDEFRFTGVRNVDSSEKKRHGCSQKAEGRPVKWTRGRVSKRFHLMG